MSNRSRTTAKDLVEQLKKQYPVPSSSGNWAQLRSDPEFFDTMLEAIASGFSVHNFCQSIGLPAAKVNAWLGRLPESQREEYRAARAVRAGHYADKILEILEGVKLGTYLAPEARALVDSYRWMAERMDPEYWGAKIQLKAEVKTTTEMHLEAVRQLAENIKRGDNSRVIVGQVEPKLIQPAPVLTSDPEPPKRTRKPKKTHQQSRKERREHWDQVKDDLLS